MSIPSPVITNPTVFDDDFLPDQLDGREEERRQLNQSLGPVIRGHRPFNVWLHGLPGSGKTALVRRVLNDLERAHRFSWVYVNAIRRRSFYAVVDQILDDLRVLAGDERDTSWKMERLHRRASHEPLIVVLDEIDQFPPKERDALIYNLCSVPGTSVVLITQSRESSLQLDARVLSRLNPTFLSVVPNSPEQILAILEARARAGLRPESWCTETLLRIARRSNGDARLAIHVLRAAAYRTEYTGGRVIEDAHVSHGFGALTVSGLQRTYLLRKLPQQQQLLLEMVRDAGPISAKHLFPRWRARCREAGYQPMSHRTFKEYHFRLRQMGFLGAKRGAGRGAGLLLQVR